MPQQDTVIAITSGLQDMQAVLNLVWEKLLPGLGASKLPRDEVGQEKLSRTLKNLSLRTPEGLAALPETAGKVFGQKYLFPANARNLESIALESKQPDATTLVARFNGVEERIECGHSNWRKGHAAWGAQKRQPIAAGCAWTAADSFTAKIALSETPFVYTISLKFSCAELRYNSVANVGFGSASEPALVGTAENKP